MVKKPIREFDLRNVSPDDFINQAKGLKLVKERKRQEKQLLERAKHNQKGSKNTVFDEATHNMVLLKHTDKRQKLSDQIQRGFNVAKKWQDETNDKM